MLNPIKTTDMRQIPVLPGDGMNLLGAVGKQACRRECVSDLEHQRRLWGRTLDGFGPQAYAKRLVVAGAHLPRTEQ
jgi:hypothetical protein